MRRSHVGGAKIEPERIIPRFGKRPEYNIKPPNSESCDVLHDDDSRSKLANDSHELEPQTASLACEASALPGERQVLTGEPAFEDVDGIGP